jgi:TonB family protein
LNPYYFAVIYFAVLAILFIRFSARLISLQLIRRKCVIEKKDGLYIALCKKQIAPFSFLKTIFIEEKEITNEQFDKIIMHEKVHIQQWHSIDIILAEILCILTWFNPIGWKIKAALKETHEYLADSGVSEQTHDSAEYFLLLIRNTVGMQPGLANNFNKSLTLKRLNMMKKNRSGRLSRLKVLLVLPFVVVLFMAFSCKNNTEEGNLQSATVSQNSEKADKTIDKMPEYPGGQAAMTKFIIDNVKYPEAAKTAGIQGKVFVTFTVTKTGKLDKISVTQKVNDLLDAEAIRVVSLMPDWIPGEDKGVAVDCEMTLPIAFKLK